MTTSERMIFECEHCGKTFSGSLFDVARESECVEFRDGQLPSVGIRGCEPIAGFCSRECRAQDIRKVMGREGVPIRPVGLGPIEPCAKCGGPVDMTAFHLTYVASDFKIDDFDHFTVLGVDYLAVVCNRCHGAVAVKDSERFETTLQG